MNWITKIDWPQWILFSAFLFCAAGWLISAFKELRLKSSKKPKFPSSPNLYRIVQPQFEQWTSDDVANLRSFFSSVTGRKIVSISGSVTFQQAMKEAAGDSLALAAGMDHMLRFQFNLASELARISGATAAQAANPESIQKNEDDALLRSF